MSDSTVASANRVQRWADKYFVEYVRGNRFKDFMGKGVNAILQVKEELTKQAGDRITYSLVGRLSGAGVTDDARLLDNEEAVSNYGHQVTVHQLRNGVTIGEFEQIKTEIDILDAGRDLLKTWSMEQLRDDIIDALTSPNVDGLTPYASCTEAQKDAWDLANNPSASNQRILFGAAKSNESANDHSANLANIDGTADDLHQDILTLGRRMAMTCDRHIRPAQMGDDDQEVYVAFADDLAFRDLEANMSTIHQNAAPRSLESNPIFRPGDLIVGNVIVREVPEMPVLQNVGDGGTTEVTPVVLCGAQAAAVCWAKRPEPRTEVTDYGNKKGAAITEIRGVEKLTFSDSRQHGVVTIYVSAVGD